MGTYTIIDMQEVATAKGGKCLSETYEGKGAKLLWECAKGHRWRATPHDVLNEGQWCMRCASMKIAADISRGVSTSHSEPTQERPELGRLCIKLSGKDAGKVCVVVEHVDDFHVLVDGFSRRKKVSAKHLVQTDLVVDVEEGAPRETVVKAIKTILL